MKAKLAEIFNFKIKKKEDKLYKKFFSKSDFVYIVVYTKYILIQ